MIDYGPTFLDFQTKKQTNYFKSPISSKSELYIIVLNEYTLVFKYINCICFSGSPYTFLYFLALETQLFSYFSSTPPWFITWLLRWDPFFQGFFYKHYQKLTYRQQLSVSRVVCPKDVEREGIVLKLQIFSSQC